MVTVEEIRGEREEERDRWLAASSRLAKKGDPFCSVDIWEKIKMDGHTRSDKRRFFSQIHNLLKPLAQAGFLMTTLRTDPSWQIARRYYWKP